MSAAPRKESQAAAGPFDAAGGGIESVLAAAVSHGLGALLPREALCRLAVAMVREPGVPLSRFGRLGMDLIAIAGGRDAEVTLDGRFADPAWHRNPLLSRVAHAYVASCDALLGVLEDADLDRRDRERLRLPLDNLAAAIAPTNGLLTNPAGWKEVIDTGGGSLRSGLANLARDLASSTKLPSSVDTDAFQIGKTLAATPGKVVRRERLYELIEYAPRTEMVDAVPVVLVPSPVNKYYLLDLEPDESVVGAHLDAGRHVFLPSWVNPDESHADVGVDAYVEALVEILGAISEISGSDRVHLLGLCGGGQLALICAAYLAAIDRQELLASLTIGIAVTDFQRFQLLALMDAKSCAKVIATAKRKGGFKAADSARSFAVMRPEQGIWANAVNNYVLGRSPGPIPLLYWAADQTNLSTRFGADMINMALENSLVRPGAVTVLGKPLDTRQITVDTYVLGASTDHISPWKECYLTLEMLGGSPTFVLAAGGHAMAISRPPQHPRSSCWTAPTTKDGPDEWLARAERLPGSWWNHWSTWVTGLTPEQRPAPATQGSARHPAIDDAPGQYVRVKAV